jgi:hypothetical protein
MRIEATFTRRVEQTATGQETQWEFESESSSSDNTSWMVVELRKLREQALTQIEQFTKSSVGERDEYPLEEELEEEELPPLDDESPKKKKQKK